MTVSKLYQLQPQKVRKELKWCLFNWMTTGNYNTAGNTKLHNFITVYATNYHYINHTITMNTTDHHNDQSCHNTIWQW